MGALTCALLARAAEVRPHLSECAALPTPTRTPAHRAYAKCSSSMGALTLLSLSACVHPSPPPPPPPHRADAKCSSSMSASSSTRPAGSVGSSTLPPHSTVALMAAAGKAGGGQVGGEAGRGRIGAGGGKNHRPRAGQAGAQPWPCAAHLTSTQAVIGPRQASKQAVV